MQWYWGAGKGTTERDDLHRAQLGDVGDHVRGPEAHAQDLPAGVLRGAGRRRRARRTTRRASSTATAKTAGLPYDEYLRGNQDFTAGVVGPRHPGHVARQHNPGAGHQLVPRRRQAVLRGPLADEAAEVLRQSTAIHEAPTAAAPVPVPCDGCPSETGEGGSSTG